MEFTTNSIPNYELAAHLISSASAFVSALLVSSTMRMNKGAKVNRAWAAVAPGLILAGIAEGSRAAEHLGFFQLEEWDGILMAAAGVFVLLGVILWYRTVRKAVR